jgi:hypothetical protein
MPSLIALFELAPTVHQDLILRAKTQRQGRAREEQNLG